MLAAARGLAGRPHLVSSARCISHTAVTRITRRRMTSSAAAASGSGSSGEQQAGQLEQMSVNDLQELLANPVLVSSSKTFEMTSDM